MLPSKTRIKGYVRHCNRRAPPLSKLKAWDAGAVSAHVTCENGARDTFPAAQNVDSVKGQEKGLNTDQYSVPPDPYQGHARGQELATWHPRACWLMPANTGELRRAQPAAPDRTPRHQSTNQATLTSRYRTAAPTREQDTARYGRQTRARAPHHGPEHHPEAPLGSTGMPRGGPKGPCHRRGCTYDQHKRS